MKFWWVNHKQTHKEEIDGGYIWSPKKNKDGSRNQTYDNLSETHVSDTVFSYAYGKIQAIGIAKSKCQNAVRPSDFGKRGEQWDRDGWLVPIVWSRLDNPINPKSHLSEIRRLLPEKHSPIQPNGNGNQKCYLAEISNDLGSTLLRIANSQNGSTIAILEDRDAILNSPMPNQFLMYWKEDQIAKIIHKDELNYAGSNQFDRLSIGDVIWIAGRAKKASLVTVGPLVVAEIVGQEEAEKRLKFEPWEATYHALNMENPFKPTEIDLTPILNQLEFISGSSTKLDLDTPIGQQLQTMRRLTDQSCSFGAVDTVGELQIQQLQ